MFKFNKKKKLKQKIKLKVLKPKEPKLFEVGQTGVNLKFLDGREFTTLIYGTISQYGTVHCEKNYYGKPQDAVILPVNISYSVTNAEYYVSHINNYQVTIVDDPKNPSHSMNGVIIEATIGDTYDFEEEFIEHELEEKEFEVDGK